jgi:hypothetical protein
MAARARLIAGAHEKRQALMFQMAFSAGGHEGLLRLMNRPVVAGSAGLIGDRF